MWVGGCECRGGGPFFKGREHRGCRQTDWGNTWQHSQINTEDREGGEDGGTLCALITGRGTWQFICANTHLFPKQKHCDGEGQSVVLRTDTAT